MGSYVSCPNEENSMMVLMKKFQLKKMMFWWSFCILLIHQPLEQQFTIKCWVSVNHVLQLLSIPTVNTSGCPYTLLKREFKDTQKQFTENLWTWKQFFALTIEICSSTSNSLIIIWNFWKHLTLIHIKASFFGSLYSYFRLFQWIYIWNHKMIYQRLNNTGMKY